MLVFLQLYTLMLFVMAFLQCENIMFTSQVPEAPVKIIDFGFAARYDPSKGSLSRQVGTFDTMAPEVFGGNYTTKADLWSAGVVAFELISGRKPFAAASQLGVIGKVASGEYNMDDKAWQKKSKSSKAFVKALIQRNTDKRLDAAAALKHKWLRTLPVPKMSLSGSYHVSQMKRYGEAPTIKKIGLLMIAHKTFPHELVKFKTNFEKFDPHNTGGITVEQFKKALLEFNQEYTDDELLKIFKSMDTSHTGEIAYTEFLAAMLE